jgi:hypothetical protein
MLARESWKRPREFYDEQIHEKKTVVHSRFRQLRFTGDADGCSSGRRNEAVGGGVDDGEESEELLWASMADNPIYYAGGMDGSPLVDFETVLGELIAPSYWTTKAPSGDPLRQFILGGKRSLFNPQDRRHRAP